MNDNSKGTPMVVAEQRPMASRQTSMTQSPLVYQSNAEFLARQTEFRALIASAARSLAPFARTAKEQQVCYDASRPDCPRLSIAGWETLIALAAQSNAPFVLEQAVQAAVINQIASPTACALEASRSEQVANEPLNLAQLLAAEEDSPVRWVQVAELCAPQIHATKTLCAAAWSRARVVS